MKKLVIGIVAVVALACVLAPNASAGPLTLSTPGVVGIYSLNETNPNSDPVTETAIANQILALGANATLFNAAPGGTPSEYLTGPVDYNGVLNLGLQGAACADFPSTCFVIPAGTLYALGKYDGPNAGYVLFYIPTFGTTLPMSSLDLWANGAGEGYGLSHAATFGSTVPDGGSMAMLLGMALIGLGGLRRLMK
jgi:hypothetical protein